MKLKLLAIFACTGLLWFCASRSVSAHEGTFSLKNSSVACEGISIWKDSRYHLTGRCAGLVYPYQERLTDYVLWVQDGADTPHRVTNINLGLFDGYASDVFNHVFITVEESSGPRNPGDLIIAGGNVQAFDFGTLEPQTTLTPLVPSALITPTPTLAPAVIKTSGIAKQSALTLAVLVGVILAIVAAIFIVRRGS